jgi:asparagine synthetase B (glutamine-hydrolysing)
MSGGIDSGIIAALMPPGTPAYTINFSNPGTIDAKGRQAYADRIYRSEITEQAGPRTLSGQKEIIEKED